MVFESQWQRSPTYTRRQSNAFVFADFEASSEVWELGQGPRKSWNALQNSGERSWDENSEIFEVNSLRNQLHTSSDAHFSLQFDIYPYKSDGRQPADDRSIVRKLLNTGAFYVEGGMTPETYLDYLCALIEMFCKREDYDSFLRQRV